MSERKVYQLKVTRPDGRTDIISVTDHEIWAPQDIVPAVVNLTPNTLFSNTVPKEKFFDILRVMKSGGSLSIATIKYARYILGCSLDDARNLVDSL